MMFRLKSAGSVQLLLIAGVALMLSVPAFGQRDEHAAWGDRGERKDAEHREQKEDFRQRVRIIIENVAVSPWDDGKNVGAEMQLQNVGNGDARDVRVTRVEVSGGRYVGPDLLPVSLGDLTAGHITLLDSVFEMPADGSPRLVRVNGEYIRGKERGKFSTETTIAPDRREPGPFISIPGEAVVQDPKHATFPPPPPLVPEGPNAESPLLVPPGPPRLLTEPTPTSTDIIPGPGTPGGPSLTPDSDSDPVVLFQHNTRISRSTNFKPLDPNAAAQSPDGVVLATYNLGISYSINGGQTFTDVDPTSPQPGNLSRTSLFPQTDSATSPTYGGLCCDQVVVYLPAQNLFVWLLQYGYISNTNASGTLTFITSANRLRIAWATPDGIRADFWNAWTYIDLTGPNIAGVSSGLGITNTEFLDYPDLAWSASYLYFGISHGQPTGTAGVMTPPGPQVYANRRIVARLALADMINPAATVVRYNFTEFSGCSTLVKDHFVQGAPGRMVVGCLDNGSLMSVYTWRDEASDPDPRAFALINQVKQGMSYSSLDPDNVDWLADFRNGKAGLGTWPGMISGATYRRTSAGEDEYLFAFQAGRNPPQRPQPYVRLESLSPTRTLFGFLIPIAEYEIWHSNYAYAIAALGSDGQEIGINLAVGGGTVGYPQMAVGYKDDFVVYQVTQNNGTQQRSDGAVRFGDYLSVRLIPANTSRFGAAVYDVTLNPLPPGATCMSVTCTCLSLGCSGNMRYVEFGRPLIE